MSEYRSGAESAKPRRPVKTRAFKVEVRDWPEATSIVLTVSADRAKFLAWSAAKEAGYGLPFGRFRVRREPLYDNYKQLYAGRCYALDYVENLYR